MGLKSRVALIQGPPGTGKSFVGSVIARTILENSNAKILCVCYTNHALDQVLEDLLKNGVTDVVRIGGRSKSEALQKYSVWELLKRKEGGVISNAGDRKTRAVLHAQMQGASEKVSELQAMCSEEFDWNGHWGEQLQGFLQEFHPQIYSELCTKVEDEEGFRVIGKMGKSVSKDHIWEEWKKGNPKPRLGRALDNESGIWNLDLPQREALFEEWRLAVTSDARQELSKCIRDFLRLHQSLKEVTDSRANKSLTEARVIGATTTGVALHKNLIEHSAVEV